MPVFVTIRVGARAITTSSFGREQKNNGTVIRVSKVNGLMPLIGDLRVREMAQMFRFRIPLCFPAKRCVHHLASPNSLVCARIIRGASVLTFIHLARRV